MTRIDVEELLDPEAAAARDRPRNDLVVEERLGPGRYGSASGPFDHYERTVELTPVTDGVQVRETIEFRLAIGVWRPLFTLPYRNGLRHGPRPQPPWWAPPDVLDHRAARVLSLLASLSIAAGYLGTVLTQTITFAVDEFGSTNSAQGATLASVRVGILLAVVVTTLADRRGRRVALIGAGLGACLFTLLGTFAPGLVFLGTTQTISRGFSSALAILIAVTAAEEMPAGSRAYAVSLLAMSAALGAGVALWVLPIADIAEPAWRVLFVVPVLFVPAIVRIGRELPESRRYQRAHADVGMTGHGRRFWLLAVSAFLLSIFAAPASQFLNDYLRDEQDFSALRISLFSITTNLPGGLGIVVAGRLADVRGRRVVGAVGIAGGALFTIFMYLGGGWTIWAWSALGAMIGSATIPALGVYGPELFPTSLRGRANGIINVVGVAGSSTGLVLAGRLSETFDRFGPAVAILGLGPALLAILIVVAYPETARRELEELNPEDRAERTQ